MHVDGTGHPDSTSSNLALERLRPALDAVLATTRPAADPSAGPSGTAEEGIVIRALFAEASTSPAALWARLLVDQTDADAR